MTPTRPEDFADASQLISRLWMALDQRRYDDIYTMLAPDARWLRDGDWQVGEAAIAGSLGRRPADMFIRHLISNVVVDADGDRLMCRYYISAYATLGTPAATPRPAAAPIVLSDVGTVCVRHGGVLKIAEIDAEMIFLRDVPKV